MAWHLDEDGQQLRRGCHHAEDVPGRHEEAAEALARHDDGLLMSRNQSDGNTQLQHSSIDLTDSPLQPSQIQVEPASVLR